MMKTNNIVLNRLFTQNVFQDLLSNKENDTYCTVIKRYINDAEAKNNGDLISEIYKYMSQSYRNEYFYQNTLLNKLLLGKHSVRTTTALTQIPIGKSKADFILINGKAIVYEIKSELDSFDRLSGQLRDYYKAFNHVCVVTSESAYDKIFNILRDSPVGIYVLTKRNTLSTTQKKEPIEENTHLDYLIIFKVLHKNEYERILKGYFGELPTVSQVFYYDECFSMFAKIPILDAYSLVIQELKKRNRIVVNKYQDVPYELKSLMYFLNPNIRDYEALDSFLNSKFRG